MPDSPSKQPKGELVIQIVAMPADTNANGDIFGGWLVSHMDMGAAIAARSYAKERVVTVAIDQLTFIKPVLVGDTVACYAELMRIGRTSIQLMIEVWSHSHHNEKPKHVAKGIFTFVAIDDEGKPRVIDQN